MTLPLHAAIFCCILSIRVMENGSGLGDEQASDGRQTFPWFPVGVGSHKDFL